MISTPFIGNWIITGSAGYQLSLILKLSEFDLGGTGERRRGEGRWYDADFLSRAQFVSDSDQTNWRAGLCSDSSQYFLKAI